MRNLQNLRTLSIHVLIGTLAISALLLTTWRPNEAGGPDAGPIRTATLRATDFLAAGLDFETGFPGGIVQDREVKNRGQHIELGNYNEESFTVGIQGGENGAILDLGHFSDLAAREGYPETVQGGQGFASIHFRDGELVILDERDPKNTYQPFVQGDDFVNAPVSAGSDTAPARLGHVYLVRIVRSGEPELITKFLVVGGSRIGKEATIVWENLQRDG